VTKNFIALSFERNKSKIRISIEAPRTETNLETNKFQIGKIQNTIPIPSCFEVLRSCFFEFVSSFVLRSAGPLSCFLFGSFEIVSNFGSFDMAQDRFRASKFLFLVALRSFDVAQDMLCARHGFFRSSLYPKNSNIFG